MSDERIAALAAGAGEALVRNGLLLVTVESCTGGWIAKAITDIPGSTGWFDRGFVTYSNAAKSELLGVDQALIKAHGAVSREVVAAMAAGALGRSGAGLAVAVSGVAGPGGGTTDKPIGTVWLAWAGSGGDCDSLALRLPGGRDEVRRGAVIAALEGIIERAGGFSLLSNHGRSYPAGRCGDPR